MKNAKKRRNSVASDWDTMSIGKESVSAERSWCGERRVLMAEHEHLYRCTCGETLPLSAETSRTILGPDGRLYQEIAQPFPEWLQGIISESPEVPTRRITAKAHRRKD